MMKKTICTLLTIGTVVSMGASSVSALEVPNSYFNTSPNSINSTNENGYLTNLLVQGKENYEIVDINGNSITSQFSIGNQKYFIDEVISDSYDRVISNYYRIVDNHKEFIGQTKTVVNKVSENVSNIQVLDNNNNVVDSQYIGNDTMTYNDNHDILENNIAPFSKVEYKWHYQYTSKGSTKILKYTVGAIITALATAAGGAAAAGLSYIATEIINDHIPNVWWTRDTYAYNQRCPDWPSYPHWIPAGKYRYRTKYYSNSSRTKYISASDYTDE